jgi:hypothetical protein
MEQGQCRAHVTPLGMGGDLASCAPQVRQALPFDPRGTPGACVSHLPTSPASLLPGCPIDDNPRFYNYNYER